MSRKLSPATTSSFLSPCRQLRQQLEETDAAELAEELEELKAECEERIGNAEKTVRRHANWRRTTLSPAQIIILRAEREALLKRLESAAKV